MSVANCVAGSREATVGFIPATCRIRNPNKTLYTYPDVSVACGEPHVETGPSGGQTLLNPRLIVEILSPSTENYDRGRKFELYREIPTLRECVVVWQSEARIQTFFRRDNGGWPSMRSRAQTRLHDFFLWKLTCRWRRFTPMSACHRSFRYPRRDPSNHLEYPACSFSIEGMLGHIDRH